MLGVKGISKAYQLVDQAAKQASNLRGQLGRQLPLLGRQLLQGLRHGLQQLHIRYPCSAPLNCLHPKSSSCKQAGTLSRPTFLHHILATLKDSKRCEALHHCEAPYMGPGCKSLFSLFTSDDNKVYLLASSRDDQNSMQTSPCYCVCKAGR